MKNFDFTEILNNAKLLEENEAFKEKQKHLKEEFLKQSRNERCKIMIQKRGISVVVQKKSDGDCVRFQTLNDLRRDCKIPVNYKTIDKIIEHEKFKNKYKFFALENDILSWGTL